LLNADVQPHRVVGFLRFIAEKGAALLLNEFELLFFLLSLKDLFSFVFQHVLLHLFQLKLLQIRVLFPFYECVLDVEVVEDGHLGLDVS